VQVVCDTSLESSQQELQFFFIPYPDRRSKHEIITPQSYESSSLGSFKILETKSHLDVAIAERCKVYYMGEGGGFPRVWAVVSLEGPKSPVVSLVGPKSPVACLSNKGAQTQY
jgi:hypothetical protein